MKTLELKSAGHTIVAICYEPTPSHFYNGITLLMSAAIGAKQTYFRHFATYLSEHGFRVLTYDYSGAGLSAPKNLVGYQTGQQQWGEQDLTTMIDHISDNYEYQKFIVLGQSVGGQIHGLSPSIHKAHGLINVVASTGYWKAYPLPVRLIVWLNWYIALPFITWLFGYFPGKRLGIVDDLPKGVALDWCKWGKSPNYHLDHIENAVEKFDAIRMPLLSYSFSDDTTSPKPTVEWLNSIYRNAQLTYKHVKPSDIGVPSIGHFGFFRPKCQVLWDDLMEEVLRMD